MEKKERDWLENLILSSKFGARIREVIPRLDEGFSNEDFEVATGARARCVRTLLTMHAQQTGAGVSLRSIASTTRYSRARARA